jgi:hypothetical protein
MGPSMWGSTTLRHSYVGQFHEFDSSFPDPASHSYSYSLVPSSMWSVLWVISRRILFFVGDMLSALGAGWGCFSRPWTLGWAILVRVCVLPWRLFVTVSGLSCMFGHPVGIFWMIWAGQFIPGCKCESCHFYLHVFNVWHILLKMTFLDEYNWNKHMYMNTYLCFSH